MKEHRILLGILIIFCFSSCKNRITEETFPAIIEITGNENVVVENLGQILNASATVYQWRDHWIIYGKFRDLPKVRQQIREIYPEATIKLYNRPFYVFDRSQCGDDARVERWSHTLMTANLVVDTILQQEYMDYHALQTELFPEVVQGFCNAGFQQLLVFRNGRQLMLVISIPEGENLDDLNPKTVENNPRVDEWNAIMAKYQEGIEGTSLGETWVIFNSIETK
jgi:L-rhamnose mutarotase